LTAEGPGFAIGTSEARRERRRDGGIGKRRKGNSSGYGKKGKRLRTEGLCSGKTSKGGRNNRKCLPSLGEKNEGVGGAGIESRGKGIQSAGKGREEREYTFFLTPVLIDTFLKERKLPRCFMARGEERFGGRGQGRRRSTAPAICVSEMGRKKHPTLFKPEGGGRKPLRQAEPSPMTSEARGRAQMRKEQEIPGGHRRRY